ncbi:Fic family protein [Polymorphobacter sp. PAMC 29334]|uniref:Fic family protein n=1 Tax=Polymorphobacter sp. PAMC 29334 TaxID=2862331 RepID=UPI001D02DF9B|nr:Fic family protein [Polymorphobacter sp. PAMC 29334]
MGEWPSQSVNDFHELPLAEAGTPAGYAALISRYDLAVPLPARLTAIAQRHHPVSTDRWLMQTPRHAPGNDLAEQLTHALRYEGVDLAVLSALFGVIDPADIAAIVAAAPTGAYARRIWFLYEWQTGLRLHVPDAGKIRLVPAINAVQQLALAEGEPSPRHRVLNNLPGTPAFCPMVRRTPTIDAYVARAFDVRTRETVGRIRRDLLSRAAAFLLLNDSKSSFAIEGERPSGDRATRWAQAIAQAGTRSLSIAEFDRLQRIVIGDPRFVQLGLRDEGGFVGVHDRDTNMPVPDHISARPQDLESLLGGLIEYVERTARGRLDPVAAAACAAFGFVYIHPYVDGNGRLHRWLIHHALALAAFNPPGLIFPISVAIYRRIDEYRRVLESYSAPLLPLIRWQPTADGNVEVLNDTADYYRYFDATAHVEFLYACVEQTIERDMPEEIRFLEAFDRFSDRIQQIVDMPAAQVELLRGFLAQNDGLLSQRGRTKEFAALADEEVAQIEVIYAEMFAAEG